MLARIRLTALVLGVAATASCGARTPLIVEKTCEGPDIPVVIDVPDLYFVLDHSYSMRELNKWTNVRSVVGQLMTGIGPRARLGATMFPGMGSNCAPGDEVMPLALGDSQGNTPGPNVQKFLANTNVDPAGGTPTAPTFRGLLPTLSHSKHAYAILATDGGPNCNPDITCGIATCVANIEGISTCKPNVPPNCCDPNTGTVLNCLDEPACDESIASLYAAGIPTFVIGIPGSDFYQPILDSMAVAGHTAKATSPKYYRVDTADASVLTGVLTDIASQITHVCTVDLQSAPTVPDGVRAYLDGNELPNDPNEGFTIDLEAQKLVLHGQACDKAHADATPKYRVTDGCIP